MIMKIQKKEKQVRGHISFKWMHPAYTGAFLQEVMLAVLAYLLASGSYPAACFPFSTW